MSNLSKKVKVKYSQNYVCFENDSCETSLAVQWLRLHSQCRGALGSIPDQGTKIQKRKKKNPWKQKLLGFLAAWVSIFTLVPDFLCPLLDGISFLIFAGSGPPFIHLFYPRIYGQHY